MDLLKLFSGIDAKKVFAVVKFSFLTIAVIALVYFVQDYRKTKIEAEHQKEKIETVIKINEELSNDLVKIQEEQKRVSEILTQLNEENQRIQQEYMMLTSRIKRLPNSKNPKDYEAELNKVYKEVSKCVTGC